MATTEPITFEQAAEWLTQLKDQVGVKAQDQPFLWATHEEHLQAVLDLLRADRCLGKLRKGEPFFVLRGQDESAGRTVRIWLLLNSDTLSQEHFKEAMELSNRLDTWEPQKRPD
jgi:hypothetical protein